MMSLRTRLTLGVCGTAWLLCAAAGGLLYWLAASYLYGQVDRSLTNRAAMLASMVRLEYGELEMEFEDFDLGEFASPRGRWFMQVRLDGESVYRSPPLAGADLELDVAPADSDPIGWVSLPGGASGRGLALAIGDPDKAPRGDRAELTLSVARDVSDETAALAALRWGLTGIGAALAAALWFAIALGVSRGLRPVRALADRMHAMDEHGLGPSSNLPHLPAELTPIAREFEQLLARLGDAFDRERGFSASIAHELRTPLAGMRAMIDVCLTRSRERRDYQDCLGELGGIVGQMHALTERLLQMVALEGGRVTIDHDDVDFNREVRDAWEQADRNMPPRGRPTDVRFTLSAPAAVRTDRALLHVVLRNVMENAATYVDDGGRVTIATAATDGRVELTVANTGSEVTADDAARVFDRLWRGDRARSDTGRRFGLGLALARLAAGAIGGTIEAHSQPGGEFRVVVRLPVAFDGENR